MIVIVLHISIDYNTYLLPGYIEFYSKYRDSCKIIASNGHLLIILYSIHSIQWMPISNIVIVDNF